MSGTKVGGAKARETNIAKYGSDYYAQIGRKGGHLGFTGGFAANRELAKEAGRKGGLISKRKKYHESQSRASKIRDVELQIAEWELKMERIRNGLSKDKGTTNEITQ